MTIPQIATIAFILLLISASAATLSVPAGERYGILHAHHPSHRGSFKGLQGAHQRQPRAQCPPPETIVPCTCEVLGVDVNVDCSNVAGTAQLNSIFATAAFPLDVMNRFRIVGNGAVTSLDYDFMRGLSFKVSSRRQFDFFFHRGNRKILAFCSSV
jgi:hypothetical protein